MLGLDQRAAVWLKDMRLLNVYNLGFKELFSEEVGIHAILSHTWERDEVTYQQFNASVRPDSGTDQKDGPGSDTILSQVSQPASSLHGFKKLKGWCQKARKEGFEWVWIDTCCIDKSSSAELSAAINAMFAWYSRASVCYAYLSDVRSDEDPTHAGSSFRRSRWFTRGWTLQELIAPAEVVFLAADWTEIGTKHTLCQTIFRNHPNRQEGPPGPQLPR